MLFLTRSPSLRSALTIRRVSLTPTFPRFLATMPPKTKRKATEESLPPKKRVKKTDTTTSQSSVASKAGSEIDPSGQPTNTKLPDEISFPERVPGTRRISAWNVCGWAATNKKVGTQGLLGIYAIDLWSIQGFGQYVEAEDADILVLTETKVRTS